MNRSCVLIGLATVALAACGPAAGDVPSAKCVLVLIDRSESAHSPEMDQLFATSLDTVIDSVSHGDALAVGWITERSAGELQLPVNQEFPPFEPGTDNPLLAQGFQKKADQELAARRDAALKEARALLDDRSRKVMNTDLFGSMELAERVFRSYPQPRKVLVILSDMVQDAEGTNFDRADLSPSARAALIARLRREGRVPNLLGAHVYVVGASQASLARARQIRDFWLEYCAAANAELPREHYGGPLIRLDE